jgi:type IV pilus assembly protein PilV
MKNQLGTSLIEVMISLFILALGFLGLAALQTRAVMLNQSSYYRGIATDLATDLAEKIRANRSPFIANVNAPTMATTPNFTSDSNAAMVCASNCYLSVTDLNEWKTSLTNSLPEATYTLTSAAANAAGFLTYTLTINWKDNRGKLATNETATSSFITVIE